MATVINFVIFKLTLLLVVSGSKTSQLPSDFPRCCLQDPQLNKCILNAAVAVKPFLRRGSEEIGVPGIGLIIFPKLVALLESPAADYISSFTNYTIKGLDDYNIREIEYDPKTFTLRGTVEVNLLFVTSLYNIQGRLHVVKVDGAGVVNGTFGPLNGTFEIQGDLVTDNGVEYYSATKARVALTVHDMSVSCDGMFGDDKELGRLTNEQLNINSKPIAHALAPGLSKLLEELLMSVVKPLMKSVPYNELFPCVS